MKIYINEKNEIKAINETNDTSLIMYEVDREEVFGNKSDFIILNYCYKITDYGYSIYPSRNYSDILDEEYRLKVDEAENKISVLESENKAMKEELSITQDAVNEILFMMMEVK